ncbi:hypothetical protein HY501_01730 [Candidatus Woesearchaeota archaeon]|nr:hypothetical protein [Candidatus Woesearchaeota archaeon]
MKKWVVLVFLLLVPIVSATLNIDGPTRTQYNFGDQVVFSGYASYPTDFEGYLQFKLVCENSSEFPYQLIPVILTNGQSKIFPGDVAAPQVTLSPFMQGDCLISANLLQSGAVVESTSSNTFAVTPALSGSFEAEKDKLQRGEVLKLSGRISKLDGRAFSGIAEIYFNTNSSKFLIDIVNVVDGGFAFEYATQLLQAGEYQVDLQARDQYGNNQYFALSSSFRIISELNVAASAETKVLNPGDYLRVSGKATDVALQDLASGSVEVTFNDKKTAVEVVNGEFTFEVQLPENLKSGKHAIGIVATDGFGNRGETQIKVDVMQVPTELKLKLENTALKPLDILEATPELLDQAGDLIMQDVDLMVLNSKNAPVYEKLAKSGQKLILQLPQFSSPGAWRISLKHENLAHDELFDVLEQKEVETSLDGMLLSITNVGNVKYADDIEVLLDDGKQTYKVMVRETLAPNQTLIVNLNEEVPTGDYSMDIPQLNKAGSVHVLDGKPVRRLDYLYLLFILGVVAFLVYELVMFKQPPKVKPQSMMSKGKIPKAYLKFENKMKSAKYIDEYRERILDEVKKTEASAKKVFRTNRKGEAYPSDEAKKPKDEGNVFSQMFG